MNVATADDVDEAVSVAEMSTENDAVPVETEEPEGTTGWSGVKVASPVEVEVAVRTAARSTTNAAEPVEVEEPAKTAPRSTTNDAVPADDELAVGTADRSTIAVVAPLEVLNPPAVKVTEPAPQKASCAISPPRVAEALYCSAPAVVGLRSSHRCGANAPMLRHCDGKCGNCCPGIG